MDYFTLERGIPLRSPGDSVRSVLFERFIPEMDIEKKLEELYQNIKLPKKEGLEFRIWFRSNLNHIFSMHFTPKGHDQFNIENEHLEIIKAFDREIGLLIEQGIIKVDNGSSKSHENLSFDRGIDLKMKHLRLHLNDLQDHANYAITDIFERYIPETGVLQKLKEIQEKIDSIYKDEIEIELLPSYPIPPFRLKLIQSPFPTTLFFSLRLVFKMRKVLEANKEVLDFLDAWDDAIDDLVKTRLIVPYERQAYLAKTLHVEQ